MSDKKLRRNRATASNGGHRSIWTSLTQHKVALILGLFSLLGILATGVLTSTSGVIVAMFTNWDKLTSGSRTQVAPPAATGDLLVYNQQRKRLVDTAFAEGLDNLHGALEHATGEEAVAIRRGISSIREKKKEVDQRYEKVFEAIEVCNPLQLNIHKTELDTSIAETQSVYDGVRSITASGPIVIPDGESPPSNTAETQREYVGLRKLHSSEPVILINGKIPPGRYIYGAELKKSRVVTIGEPGITPEELEKSLVLPRLRFPMGRQQILFPTLLAGPPKKDPDPKGLGKPE